MISAKGTRRSAALVLLVAAVSAPSAKPAAAEDVRTRLDRYLVAASARLDFSGSVLVVRDGRILLRRGYGFADPGRRTPNRPSTRFRISSLTSDVTLVALLQLVDRGRLDLDDSLCVHLRPCPDGWRPITMRLLATARSGLPSARPLPRSTLTLSGWMALLRSRPLAFPAGRGHDRSEARLLVAAQVLTAVSGMSWQQYVARHVLRPAGMRATTLDHPGLGQRARPSIRRRDRTLGPPASFPPLSDPDVLYGLASTVDDMYRFDVARRSGRLVSRGLLREVGEASGMGDWPDRFAHLGHGPRGTSDGWYTAFARDPRQRITFLAFSNMGGYPLSDVLHRLALIASGWPPPRVTADPLVLERYAGRYARWDGSKRRRVATEVRPGPNGTLVLSSDEPAHPRSSNRTLREARWRWTLLPTSGGTFYVAGPDGIRVTLEQGAQPGDDVLVVEFVSLGGGHRYRREPP